MSKIKKIFPILFFFAVFLFGITMLMSRAFFRFSGNQLFLCISLITIGFIGGFTMLCITIAASASKNYKKLTKSIKETSETNNKNEQTQPSLQETIKNFISNPFQINNKSKKIACPYCKCKYDLDKERCPNCGAPPNF